MIDIANNPRLTQLLGRIEEVRRSLGSLPEGSQERAKQEATLAGFYVEVGRYVHWLMRQDAETLARVEAESKRWASEADAFLSRRGPVPAHAAEGPNDPPTGEYTFDSEESHTAEEDSVAEWSHEPSIVPSLEGVEALPEVEIEPMMDDPSAASVELPMLELVEIEPDDVSASQGVRIQTAAGGAVHDVVSDTASMPRIEGWIGLLKQVIGALGKVPRELGGDANQQEKTRLIRATTNLETRWAMLPGPVREALLGEVASRARAVRNHVGVDVDLRLAMGRLNRFHETCGLAPMACLDEDTQAPDDHWLTEARRWRRTLKERV